jgi:hypothetical protein
MIWLVFVSKAWVKWMFRGRGGPCVFQTLRLALLHWFSQPRVVCSWQRADKTPCGVAHPSALIYECTRDACIKPDGTIVFSWALTHHCLISPKQLQPQGFEPCAKCTERCSLFNSRLLSGLTFYCLFVVVQHSACYLKLASTIISSIKYFMGFFF